MAADGYEEMNYLTEATQLQSKSLVWTTAWSSHCITFSIILPHKFSETFTDADLSCVSVEVTTKFWGTKLGDGKRRSRQERISVSVQRKVPILANKGNVSACKSKVAPPPHLGASPDSLLTCTCCGDGLPEIKYSHSLHHTPLNSAGKDFYLKHTQDGPKLSSRAIRQ